jgi:hypothetical protein
LGPEAPSSPNHLSFPSAAIVITHYTKRCIAGYIYHYTLWEIGQMSHPMST